MVPRLRVGVLFGGRSGEHEVSVMSAVSVVEHLDPSQYEVICIGITPQGDWVKVPSPQADWTTSGARSVSILPQPNGKGLCYGDGSSEPLDVVFPVLHGPYGEDGTIQGLLELAGLPYVGAGVLGSAVSMDKDVMKRLFLQAGLPVLTYRRVMRRLWEQDRCSVLARLEDHVGYPCFVKPANLGSSVGISRAKNRRQLELGLEHASLYDGKMLVETAAPDAHEIECSLMGNDDLQVSIPGEIIPSRDFYDYAAKYEDGTSQLLIPAPLAPDVTARVQQLALAAYRAVDASGYGRVDLFVQRQDHRVWVNEINTIPGFTSISMFPKLWEASGVGYSELLNRLITLALERHADKERNVTSCKPNR